MTLGYSEMLFCFGPMKFGLRNAGQLNLQLDSLNRVAVGLNDADGQATTPLTSKRLRKLRLHAFMGGMGAVVNSAACADVAPKLAKQGLTPKNLKPLADALKAH